MLATLVCATFSSFGCSLGPRALLNGRLRFNEAVKVTSEQQLLLNIVRLRYTDTPSSLSIVSIADQQEFVTGLGIVPFFTSAGAGDIGSYRNSILPQAQMSKTNRPTLSYTPMDDEEFTRRLFTPISLEGVAYLSKTTWPISTVFRLYLENLNWISNAETASGPTPREPPDFARFSEGILALQRLQDRKLITLFEEEREDTVGESLDVAENTAANVIESFKNELDLKVADGKVTLVRPRRQPVLRVGEVANDDVDWLTFCHGFRLNPDVRTFDLTSEKLDPYLRGAAPTGLELLDLETRSLLQVLFFVSHGVEVPSEHISCGIAPATYQNERGLFDWQQVMSGLFRVRSIKSRKPPACACVAIQYKGYWYYIDERDRDSKATFALLLEVSRLELNSAKSEAPLLTLPLGS